MYLGGMSNMTYTARVPVHMHKASTALGLVGAGSNHPLIWAYLFRPTPPAVDEMKC